MTAEEQKVLDEMRRQLNELHVVLYQNGFSATLKRLDKSTIDVKIDVAKLREAFNVFIAGRESTCPFRKSRSDKLRERVLIIGVIFSGFSSLAALLTVLKVLTEVL